MFRDVSTLKLYVQRSGVRYPLFIGRSFMTAKKRFVECDLGFSVSVAKRLEIIVSVHLFNILM